MGGGEIRSAAGAGGGTSSPPDYRDLCSHHSGSAGGTGGDHNNPDCLHRCWRSGSGRLSCELQSARRQRHGGHSIWRHLEAKKLELLHQLVPKAATIGVLINPSWVHAETQSKDLQTAARTLGRQIDIVNASNEGTIDTALVTLAERRIGALLVTSGPFFASRRDQLVALAERYGMPAIYAQRELVAVGALMSYGTNLADGYRQVGVYTGRILKGEKPADLPVIQPTKFEFVINMKTAKTLGLDVRPTLLAIAVEVIE